MSVSSDDPNDPLYYAPPAVRGEVNLRSNSNLQTSSERSRFVESLEDALAKSRGIPLEPEFVFERDKPGTLLGVTFRIIAAISALATVAFVFFVLVPKLQRSPAPELAVTEDRTLTSAGAADDRTASVGGAKITPEESRALLQKFISAGAAKTTPEEPQGLLQKFVRWRQG